MLSLIAPTLLLQTLTEQAGCGYVTHKGNCKKAVPFLCGTPVEPVLEKTPPEHKVLFLVPGKLVIGEGRPHTASHSTQ